MGGLGGWGGAGGTPRGGHGQELVTCHMLGCIASQDLQSWVDGASEHGFVLVSFGAGVKFLSEDIAHKLAGALGRLPQKVIWRYGRPAPRFSRSARRRPGTGTEAPAGLAQGGAGGTVRRVGVRGGPPRPLSFTVISLCLTSGREGDGGWVISG